MWSILKWGGFHNGGVNFDAKVRRESFEPIDLFYAHIGGMDAFAFGLRAAAAMHEEGKLQSFVGDRYESWDEGIGARIEAEEVDLPALEAYMLEQGDVGPLRSGRQEFLENVINDYVLRTARQGK